MVATLVVPPMWAQDAGMEAQVAASQQQVRAARLTFVQGAVTVEGAGISGSEQAQINMPLVAGVQIATANDGQAEVEFEDGSLLRLTPNSSVSLDTMSVDGNGVAMTTASVGTGLVYAELRAIPQYKYTVRAGQDVLSPVENVTVRISFDAPPAAFAVLSGTAAIADANSGAQRQVTAGETLTASAQQAGQYAVTQGLADESWDAWNADRDQEEAAEAVDRTDVRNAYAGAQGYGWSDLDAAGTWYDVPGQGEVWQPAIAEATAGWDPYGFGSWVWYPTTGYVWSSGYAWGWTPYRCGDWGFYGGFGWGWSPVGCGGGLGWAFLPAGGPVHIVAAPGWYKVPHVPTRPPGPVHPIVPVRVDPIAGQAALAGTTGWGTALLHGQREINGQVVKPVPKGNAAVNGTLPVRSGLDKDFPVDRDSHVAVMGREAAQPGMVRTESGWQRATDMKSFTGQSGAAVFRNQQQRPVVTSGTAVSAEGQRQTYVPAPAAPAAVAPQVRPGYVPGSVVRPGVGRAVGGTGYTPAAPQRPMNVGPPPVPRMAPPPAPRMATPPVPRMAPPPAPRMAPPPPPAPRGGSGGRSGR